jgi:hypothetical protein
VENAAILLYNQLQIKRECVGCGVLVSHVTLAVGLKFVLIVNCKNMLFMSQVKSD